MILIGIWSLILCLKIQKSEFVFVINGKLMHEHNWRQKNNTIMYQ